MQSEPKSNIPEEVSSAIDQNKSFVAESASKVTESETYAQVQQGAGAAWDKTKEVSSAAAEAVKPAAIATQEAAASLLEKAKNVFSSGE